MRLNINDLLHIQWTGSNTHNNEDPRGDGEAGNDGQGEPGTDRNNLVQVSNLIENFPLPFEMADIWKDADLIGFLNNINYTDDSSLYLNTKIKTESEDISKDMALYFSSSSFYECVKKTTCGKKKL